MLRIKKQSRKGTRRKEYPQMVMQKPIEAISTCADLVGRSRGSRRDFPRSLYQHCPSPTLRATLRATSEPALTRLQEHSVCGWSPFGFTLGSSASWPGCFLNRDSQNAYRLSTTVSTHLCLKCSPFELSYRVQLFSKAQGIFISLGQSLDHAVESANAAMEGQAP